MRKLLLSFSLIFVLIIAILAFTSCGQREVLLPVEREVDEPFRGIYIDVSTAAINIYPRDDGVARVTTYDSTAMYHNVSVEDGILVIEFVDERQWYDKIFNISYTENDVAVYLPEEEYESLVIDASTGYTHVYEGMSFGVAQITVSTGDVEFHSSSTEAINIAATTGDVIIGELSCNDINIATTTGRVDVSCVSCKRLNASTTSGSINVGELTIEGALELEATSGDISLTLSSTIDVDIELTTGDVMISELECENLEIESTTGDVLLEDVIASEIIDIQLTTGDVEFDNSDAKKIYVETDTGSVSGTLLSVKKIITQTTTGDIDVPISDPTTEDICEIKTTTGDITIAIVED